MTRGGIVPFLFSLFFVGQSSASTIEDHYPLEKVLGGVSTIKMRGDADVKFEQDGDTTTVKLEDNILTKIEAPQFVKKVIKSPNKEYLLLLIDSGAPMGEAFASNYFSILRFRFTEKGAAAEEKDLLKKSGEFMKPLNRWVVKIDSVLNDGRTVRMYFGEQKSADDPSMEMGYAWQIRDIVTGKLYRTEKKPEKK